MTLNTPSRFPFLRKPPGFLLAAILVLAVGGGAATAIYAVLRALYVHALPYREPSRLVALHTADRKKQFPTIPHLEMSLPRFREWASQFKALEASVALTGSVEYLRTPSGEQRVSLLRTIGDPWGVFGVRPILGALPKTGDLSPTIVLTYELWKEGLGGDLSVIGHGLDLGGRTYTVAAVLPQGVWLPFETSAAVPFVPRPDEVALESSRGDNFLDAMGRMRPGVTKQDLDAELEVISRRCAELHSEDRDWGVAAVSYHTYYFGDLQPTARLLGLAGGALIVLASFNLANLLLARGLARRRELALRIALGGGFLRVFGTLLREAAQVLVPGLAGAALVAWLMLPSLRELLPLVLQPRCVLAWDVLGFLAAACLLMALLATAVPTLCAPWRKIAETLQEGGRGSEGRRTSLLRRFLVASQGAMAVLLLTASGLLILSLARERHAPLGFRLEHRYAFSVMLEGDDAKQQELGALILERVGAPPGVEGAALMNRTPLGRSGMNGTVTLPDTERNLQAHFRTLTPGGLGLLEIPLRQGRDFRESDYPGQPVCLVSEAFARHAWPGEPPLGRSVAWNDRTWTVAGVVGNVFQEGAKDDWLEMIYFPYRGALGWPATDVIVRSSLDGVRLLPRVREALAGIGERGLHAERFASLEERRERLLGPQRQLSLILGLFGLASLGLAVGGMYALFDHDARRRSMEAGIRSALGAQPRQVVWGILGRALLWGGAGLVAGLAALPLIASTLVPYLYAVRPLEPSVLLLSLALVLLAMGFCALLPALRLARIIPSDLLRRE